MFDYQQPRYYTEQRPVINTLQNQRPNVFCYFVNNLEELSKVNVDINTFYIGISQTNNEVYIRNMNNNGIIENKVYSLKTGTEEQNINQEILNKLNLLLEKKDESNNSDDTAKTV